MDSRAITHILSRPHEYPKPGFVRDTLASMAGEQGLLVVEGKCVWLCAFYASCVLFLSRRTIDIYCPQGRHIRDRYVPSHTDVNLTERFSCNSVKYSFVSSPSFQPSQL